MKGLKHTMDNNQAVKQKSMFEIIKETVQFYSEDPKNRRAVENNFCHYSTDDGRMCAVGRCLIDPKKLKLGPIGLVCGREGSLALNKILKPEYTGHPIEFWSKLQMLHDDSNSWNNFGISDEGKNRVLQMIKEFCPEEDGQNIHAIFD